MDPALYKDLTTSRGLVYHYYAVPAQAAKRTLLFCHGFPSNSRDWRYISSHFQQQGYGIIVPDMLGYGGTAKPTDPVAYKYSLICKDLVDVLDAEGVQQAVAIGHDWGSRIVSRLANYYPERFMAYAFFAVPFYPPNASISVDQYLASTKKRVGYELIGYWLFFSESGAAKIIQENWDSFLSVVYPQEPTIWSTNLTETGALKATLLSGFKGPLPRYISEEDKQYVTKTLLSGGMEGPLCWYKVVTSDIALEDDKTVLKSHYYPPIRSPLFYGAAEKDAIALAATGKKFFTSERFKNHSVTVREFDADHWLILSHPDEINKELEAWLDSFAVPVSKAHL